MIIITDFQRLGNFDALYDASYFVCRNVRWKDSTICFEENRVENILSLQDKLNSDTYKQLVFSCFSIIERGKQRDIRACHIQDRMLQNSLCSQVLIPILTPTFVYDNCATLKGKGQDFALNRVKWHLRKANNSYNKVYALKIDIKKYFDSIDHDYLKEAIKHKVKDEKTYKLVCYIVDTFCFKKTKDEKPVCGKQYYIANKFNYIPLKKPIKKFHNNKFYYEYDNKSLGLGSQASQLLALLCLDGIDHFIKEKLHIKHYGRYMDDIFLLHDSKEYLNYCKKEIAKELAKIGLQLNERKTKISLISKKQPLKFLKWNFYLTNSGKVIQLPFKEKIVKQKRRLRKMQKMWLDGKISNQEVVQQYLGFRAHLEKGNTYYILQKLDKYFVSLFKGVKI